MNEKSPLFSGLYHPFELLYFEGNHGPDGMVYQIFTDAAVEEVREACASVRTHPDQVGIHGIREVDDAFFNVRIVVDIQ